MLSWEQQADRIDELEQLCEVISEDAERREKAWRQYGEDLQIQFEERRLALAQSLALEKEKVAQLTQLLLGKQAQEVLEAKGFGLAARLVALKMK